MFIASFDLLIGDIAFCICASLLPTVMVRNFRPMHFTHFNKKNKNMIKKKCKYCNEKFEGSTEKEVDTKMVMHKLTKHRNKVEIKE